MRATPPRPQYHPQESTGGPPSRLPCLSHPSLLWIPQESPWFLSHHKKSWSPVSSPLCSVPESPAFLIISRAGVTYVLGCLSPKCQDRSS